MRLRRLFGVGLIVALFWAPTPSAQAHAELVTSNPAVNAHIDAVPSQVSVTFDGNLLTIGGAKTNVLIVKDPTGIEIDAKNSRVNGATLSVDVNPVVASGEFSVSWRVVSGDGHPEQSSYRFTVKNPQTGVDSTPTPVATSTTSTPVAHGSNFWPRYRTRLLLLLGGVIAIGIWARFERVRRKSE